VRAPTSQGRRGTQAIDDAVNERQRQFHNRPRDDRAVAYDRPFLSRPAS
jgi:hypothetical protein